MSADGGTGGLWWRGVVTAACAGACVGLADVARALALRRELIQAHDAFAVVLFYAACFAPCGLVAALVARAFDMPQRALHLLVGIGAAFFFVGAWANVSLLPGFTSGPSIFADLGLLVAAALWFRSRYRDTARDGMRLAPWMIAGCLAVAAAFAVARLVPSRGDGPAPEAVAAPDSKRPNVLVCLCDALRADHLGCYGYKDAKNPTSPEIDAFAKDATLFDDCRSVSPWTKPSVASMMTSLYPTVHACVEQPEVLVPEAETIAEVFRAAGWRTAAFVDNPFITPEFGFGQGFDDFDSVPPNVCIDGTLLGKALFMVAQHAPVGDSVRRWCGLGAEETRGCRALHSALLAKFGGPSNAPWFAYVHAMETHLRANRYEPARTDANSMGFPTDEPYVGPPPYNGMLPFDQAPKPPDELKRNLVQLYDASIRGFSRGFGELVDELRRRGILENTVVVLVADHGEEFHEHGGWTHGHSLHQEVTRVPLVVRLPDSLGAAAKASRGRKILGVASLLDVFPTLVDVCGIHRARRDGRQSGVSLAPLFAPPAGGANSSVPERTLLGEVTMGPVGIRSIREGQLLLVVAHEPMNDKSELYNDVGDPRHRNDRIDDIGYALQAKQLRARLDEDFSVLEKAALSHRTRDLDPDTLERLKGLGYTGK